MSCGLLWCSVRVLALAGQPARQLQAEHHPAVAAWQHGEHVRKHGGVHSKRKGALYPKPPVPDLAPCRRSPAKNPLAQLCGWPVKEACSITRLQLVARPLPSQDASTIQAQESLAWTRQNIHRAVLHRYSICCTTDRPHTHKLQSKTRSLCVGSSH